MKHIDEYRDAELAARLSAEIARLADRPSRIMEVCGGHTHTIFKYGIGALLPSEIDLIHGPGCPVCVIPLGRVDDAVAIAVRPEVIFTTFGDALRVPGSNGSLLDAKARGADVRTVYSPLDALKIAADNPSREVVFFAIGFETTAPATALTVLAAERAGVRNFSLFCNHVLIIPALQALLDAPDMKIDGFIGPGHVSTVIGTRPYEFIARHYQKPVVIAGFEPIDLLQAIALVVKQRAQGRSEVENQYRRVVTPAGSASAQAAIAQVFTARDHFEWRGLGSIPASALRLRDELAQFDAEAKFSVPGRQVADARACQCGEILKGVKKPWECKVFGNACTPATPIGACMVSSEGACAAYYNLGRL